MLIDGRPSSDDSDSTFHPGRFRWLVLGGLGLIVLLGAFLRLYQLGTGGFGNPYYAAAVKSMLSSWHNFFFVSFEPGGSVSVDKPPLGFWIEAASALVLGVNGFALALPNALAGVLSIPLLYQMVRRPFGPEAGLISALVLAVMPITIATERNNTIDGLLVFSLLAAAWAFLQSVYSGKVRFLLLGALVLGLAFNIKMLEAFMPLPAFYLVYLLGAPHPWRRRLVHLGLASLVLFTVSFSWAAAVDLTPPADRPYVGSSTTNSEFDLIFGWNGISRLFQGAGPANPSAGPGAPGLAPPPEGPVPTPGGHGGFSGFGNDVPPGLLRLFSQPLVEEAGWLLPLALLAALLTLLVLLSQRRAGLSDYGPGGLLETSRVFKSRELGLVLWSAWLVPEVIYFSFTTGLFHPYYLIMLGPPLAALAGGGVWALQQAGRRGRWLGWSLAALVVSVTAIFQITILKDYYQYAWLAALIIAAGLGGLALLVWQPHSWQGRAALALFCVSLLAAPLAWSANVTLNPIVDQTGLPSASQFLTQTGQGLPGGFGGPPAFGGAPPQANRALIDYLQANTPPGSYLLAVDSAMQAAPIVLATGRPVLTFGGFTGNDPVVDAAKLSQMVSQGRLRFILTSSGLSRQKPDLSAWILQNCRQTPLPGAAIGGMLYDCR